MPEEKNVWEIDAAPTYTSPDGDIPLPGVLPPLENNSHEDTFDTSGLPPGARRTLNQLLNPAAPRPTTPADAGDNLRAIAADYATTIAAIWPEPTLRIGKAHITAAEKCEGLLLANRRAGYPDIMPTPVAVGQVVHRAVQMMWTHPGHTPAFYVRAAATGCQEDSADFADYWAAADTAGQSDVLAAAAGRVASFADTFPPLLDDWSPRFEETITVKTGALTVVARPDFMLGRPKPSGARSMIIVDIKSGELTDSHRSEALFYAAVATMRFHVMPWRTTVLSLATGEWTDPDFTYDDLVDTVHSTGKAAVAAARVWSENQPPQLTPGGWCRWCPVKTTCTTGATWLQHNSKPY